MHSNSLNSVTLIGHVGQDAELHTGKGQVLSFSLATNEAWKDKEGERQTRTAWHRCVVFGPRAEKLVNLIKTGQFLCLRGSIAYSQYKDNDGNTRYSTDIQADDVVLLGPNKASNSGGSASSGASGGSSDAGKTSDIDDDLPF